MVQKVLQLVLSKKRLIELQEPVDEWQMQWSPEFKLVAHTMRQVPFFDMGIGTRQTLLQLIHEYISNHPPGPYGLGDVTPAAYAQFTKEAVLGALAAVVAHVSEGLAPLVQHELEGLSLEQRLVVRKRAVEKEGTSQVAEAIANETGGRVVLRPRQVSHFLRRTNEELSYRLSHGGVMDHFAEKAYDLYMAAQRHSGGSQLRPEEAAIVLGSVLVKTPQLLEYYRGPMLATKGAATSSLLPETQR